MSAKPFVIGIEQEIKFWIKRLVVTQELIQYDLLKEPGRVPEVPFGRGDILHRLDDMVLDLEWLADSFGPASDGFELG